jgi:tetratricopeptide (TPR) repeat protein
MPDVQAEAEVHIGHLWLGAKKPADALEHAQNAIRTAHEAGIAYLAHMLAGRALEKLDDTDGAIHEYRLAIDAMPGAQSATTTLAALLISRDRPGEASDFVDRSLAQHPRDDDPWRLYDYGEYWRYRDLIAQLRKEWR